VPPRCQKASESVFDPLPRTSFHRFPRHYTLRPQCNNVKRLVVRYTNLYNNSRPAGGRPSCRDHRRRRLNTPFQLPDARAVLLAAERWSRLRRLLRRLGGTPWSTANHETRVV